MGKRTFLKFSWATLFFLMTCTQVEQGVYLNIRQLLGTLCIVYLAYFPTATNFLPVDKIRRYRVIRLENGLTALLISGAELSAETPTYAPDPPIPGEDVHHK